jgi:hypothetical protein
MTYYPRFRDKNKDMTGPGKFEMKDKPESGAAVLSGIGLGRRE